MPRSHLVLLILFLQLATCFHLCALPATTPSAAIPLARDGDAIIAKILANAPPQRDSARTNDDAYMKAHTGAMRANSMKTCALALELYQRFPKHPKAMWWLKCRWSNLSYWGERDTAIAEINQFLEDHPDSPEVLDVRIQLIYTKMRGADMKPDEILAEAESFIRLAPRDERGGDLLLSAAEAMKGEAQRKDLFRRILLEYPASDAGSRVAGKLRQAAQIGMPFRLGFHDVLTNEWIHTVDLKGKIIIVNFWATWCPPCVGEIPHLKELYAKYKPQGLEIIGVNLDGPSHETDLDKLKKYLKDNQVTWPQYYQGEGFESAFSRSWGINGIPTMFVIDADGKLQNTNARFELDKLIPKLLDQRK